MAGYKVPIVSMVSAPVAQQIIQFNGTNWLPTGALPSQVLVLESEMSAVQAGGGWPNGASLASCHSATSELLTAVDSQLLLIESEVSSNDVDIASIGSIHAATRSELQLVSAAGGGGLSYDSDYSCLIGAV